MVRVHLCVHVLDSYVLNKEVQNVDELLTWLESICQRGSEWCLYRNDVQGFAGEDDLAAHIQDKCDVKLELRRQKESSLNCKPLSQMRRDPRRLYCVEFAESQPWGKDATRPLPEILEEAEEEPANEQITQVTKIVKSVKSAPGFFRRPKPNVSEEDTHKVDWIGLGQTTEPWPTIHVRGRETLVSLVNHDIEEAMRFFLQGRVEANLCDDADNSLLHWAVYHGLDDVVKKLIDYQANIGACNVNDETPLLVACRMQRNSIAKYLIRSKATPDPPYSDDCQAESATPLIWACMHGNIDIVHALCFAGANVALHDTNGICPLHVTAMAGFTEITKLLLRFNAAPDARRIDNCTPIAVASRYGQSDDVCELLQALPKPDPENPELCRPCYPSIA